MSKAQQDSLVEKVEVLDGSRRGSAVRRAAVRIENLGALLELPPSLKAAKAAGSTPTAAEFDALVDDLTKLHARLIAVATALQSRLA